MKEAVDKRERVLSLNRAGRKVIADATPHWQKAQKRIETDTAKFLRTPTRDQLLQALEGLLAAADPHR